MDSKINNTVNSIHYHQFTLQPGHLAVVTSPYCIRSILGSCVAVVFYNKRLKAGAICHAQLAEEKKRASIKCKDTETFSINSDTLKYNKFKYVTGAVKFMYEEFQKMGISNNEINVKIYGGSTLFNFFKPKDSVGESNLNSARKILKDYKLNISFSDIGGKESRTIYFYSDTGAVIVKTNKISHVIQ